MRRNNNFTHPASTHTRPVRMFIPRAMRTLSSLVPSSAVVGFREYAAAREPGLVSSALALTHFPSLGSLWTPDLARFIFLTTFGLSNHV